MQDLALRLISEEQRASNSSCMVDGAAFRVCEKLRRPLSIFAGAAGARSLLSRALALAKAEVPWLAQLRINPDGSIAFPADYDSRVDQALVAKGGNALLEKVIELLVTFIGDRLTLRLVQDVWPEATLESPDS